MWTVAYIPTLDGPSHTYNGWLLRQSANSEAFPLFHRAYELNPLPVPNWNGHVVLAGLMLLVPPIVAERLLVSGCIWSLLGR